MHGGASAFGVSPCIPTMASAGPGALSPRTRPARSACEESVRQVVGGHGTLRAGADAQDVDDG